MGGFRGGGTFAANTDADWRFLDNGLIQTLRHVTLAFHDDLVASQAGRAVIVSGTAVDTPAAGSANYAAAKAAAEAWMRALADSFRRSQSGRKDTPRPADQRGGDPGGQGAGRRRDAGSGAGADSFPGSPTPATWRGRSSASGREMPPT